ncbi:heme oxygenase-like, multi-helical [Trema orientale]|uniref:Heme oxygenase-like, multi-helical n=1 Tax=Trema orientale TaxID=63057 RepID=A0A2P5D0M0_TREOI|nr:heme oxygenase-like, multi-helical [Trema orientale]
MAEGGGIAKTFWKKYEKQECAFLRFSPFSVSVAAGNLHLQSFHKYICMDLHFLQSFVQAYRIIEDWVIDEVNKKLIRELKECLQKMIQKYRETNLDIWGFKQLPEISGIDLTTDKYLDLLFSTAFGKVEGNHLKDKHGQVPAYTLAVIAPFMRLYVYLAQHILPLTELYPNNTSDHIYKKWLLYYSSQRVQDIAESTEQALNKISASSKNYDLKMIEKLYHQAMKLLVGFFAVQSISQPTVVPLYRVQDVNKRQLAIFSNFSLTRPGIKDRSSLKYLKTEFHDRTSEYYRELKHYIETITASDPAISKFDYDGLCIALKQVTEFKKKTTEKMEESGVMKDLSLDNIQNAIPKPPLFDDWREFFQKTVKAKCPSIQLSVISHFSFGDMIRNAFPSDLEALNVHSDELEYTEDSVTTGKIVKAESPFDKFEDFPEVLKVYIGATVEDLLCLVQADIGIVLGSKILILRKVAERFGVSFIPLLNGVVKNQMELGDWKPKSGILYTVDSFAEIQAFIFGL